MSDKEQNELRDYMDSLKTAMTHQWAKMNESITAFECSLINQRKIFEKSHLKMLQDIHKETQKCVSDLHSKSNDIRNLVTVVRDKLCYIATQQNLEKISHEATKYAIIKAKELINRDLWDEKLEELFNYLTGVTEAIENFSKVTTAYDLRLKIDHPSLFKKIHTQNLFLKTLVDEAEFSVRTQTSLTRGGLKTMEDVFEKGSTAILKLQNIGKRSVKEIKNAFEKNDIEWSTLPSQK